jgi:hypothetical protein
VKALEKETPWIGYSNADIQILPKAWSLLQSLNDHEVMLVSRAECDGGQPAEMMTYGVDTLFFRTAWWLAQRHRFRDYLIGEGCWDVVYTSLALRHGRGQLWNQEPLVLHERHAPTWHDSPFAVYNWHLATLDNPAFSRWCDYHQALLEARQQGASAEEETRLQILYFQRRLSCGAMLYHAGRCCRSKMRYWHWLCQGDG